MYSECVSLSESIRQQSSSNNVLFSFSKFSADTGHEVVLSVLKPLEELVSGKSDAPFLSTSQQVDWTMEVIGYGLTLPLSDKNLLQGCVNVYRDWLTALYFKKRTVPQPLFENPNRYASLIFSHLCALFVPRDEIRFIEDHVELCSKVLEMVQAIIRVKKGLKMTRDTWESMFTFLLRICDTLLAPPTSTPSLGTSLCELLIHVLFTSWLRACQDCFPTPNMWKTLRELCCNWRHHYDVIDQWTQLMYSITIKVVNNLYGPKHLSKISPLPPQDQDFRTLLESMADDAVVQCWFRMLHTLGNPVDLLYPEIITSSPAFKRASVQGDSITSPVSILPNIFHSVMKGVSAQVSLFLGRRLPEPPKYFFPDRSNSVTSTTVASSPSMRRRDNQSKSQFYVPPPASSHPTAGKKDSFYINITPDKTKSPLAIGSDVYSSRHGIVGKPTGNTLLHIFGNWLFEAAVWEGQDQEGFPLRRKHQSSTTVISSTADITRLNNGASSINTQQRLRDYELGRAEAFGSLCMIMSHMPCGEDVMKVYLARFYHSMFIGLKYNPQTCAGHVLTRIITMSNTILRKDLSGVNVLILPFLTALENTLSGTNQFKGDASVENLRRASISLLLSILPLPLHFIHLTIPDMSFIMSSELTPKPSSQTFYSLRYRVLKLLFTALETETDPINIRMLLHGLMVYLQDLATYEQSVSKMVGENEATAETQVSSSYKEDGSLCVIFSQAIVCAHSALVNHPRENTVTLASLELLSGLARLQFDSHTHTDCHDAVQWVCEFIEARAQEKPYLQTKNLHTSIVAAFKTLMVWVMEHPHLLIDESCLSWLLRVTEFGITGSFSMDAEGCVTNKEDKTAHPVSGRVKEIAEFMLYCVMEKCGSFPSPCGAAASGSLLTEEEIIKRLNKSSQDTKFEYYLLDGSMIIGLLEATNECTGSSTPLPTVSIIIRGPAGRQSWSIQMRQHPRSVNPADSHLVSQPRPVPLTTPPPCPNLKRPPWPDEVEKEAMKQSTAIPDVDDVLSDPQSLEIHNRVCQLLENEQTSDQSDSPPPPSSAKAIPLEPPRIKEKFDTVRLFLNHIGLLNVNNVKPKGSGSPSIASLDSSSLNFRSSLANLDRIPTRYCDSVFVIYCKKGQRRVEDILSHQQNLHSKPVEYVEFLHGLGWVVDPIKHPGFSGKLRPEQDEGFRNSIGLSVQIPYRSFPYYADALNEIAFIQPSLRQSASNSTSSIRSVESSDSGPETASTVDTASHSIPTVPSTSTVIPMWNTPVGSGVQESSVQADIDHSKGGGGKTVVSDDTPRRRTATPQDCAAVVVWLECFEDYVHFPLETMSKILHRAYCKTADGRVILPTIFIHKLGSGLYQIATRSSSLPPCGPLIDGTVVSRRCLSDLVRATVANLCFSYRLDNEGYSPPHVKRKRKIEDIGNQFTKHQSVSELYTELISNIQ